MTTDPKVERRVAEIGEELDQKTTQRRQAEADVERLGDECVALIVEGARLGMPRSAFVDRPFSNRWLSKIFQKYGLGTRPRKAKAATSGRRKS